MRESMKVKMEANSPPPADLVEDANPSRRMKSNPQQNGQQNGIADEGAASMDSSLTVEKYILQLHQKDEKIRKLEEENRMQRLKLLAKTNEHKARVDELVAELERHAELVTKLQNELLNSRKNLLSSSQASSKSTVTMPLINNKRESPPSKKVRRMPQLTPTNVPPPATTSQPKKANYNSASQMTQQAQNLSQNSDEIFAKLQTFVEKNGQMPTSSNNFMATEQTNQNLEEFGPEQMVKAMTEDPNLFQAFLQFAAATNLENVGQPQQEEEEEEEGDKIDPTSLLATLFAADPSANALILGDLNGTGKKQESNAGGAQEDQQNLDFEEVMQRVIGEAMNGGNNGDHNNNGENEGQQIPQIMSNNIGGRGAKGKGGFSLSAPIVNTAGGTKAATGKRKGGVGNGTPIIGNGTPLALPKGPTINNKGNVKKEMIDAKNIAPGLMTPANSMVQHLPISSTHSSSSSTTKPFTAEEQKLVDELEARIDENIVQLGLRPLNTAELAVQCTRMMREYSIGQRLFAKTVMFKVSQSQGSLSELLSKPRPWHKLTDKGRDSFRRIFGWISDDVAIELLCQLSPRKVTLTEKIVHPDPAALLEALDGPDSAAMLESSLGTGKKGLRQTHSSSDGLFDQQHSLRIPKMEKNEPNVVEQSTKMKTAESTQNGMATMFTANANNAAGGRWRHDDIPKEKIIAIHEAEKAKLMEKNETKTGIGSESSRIGSLSPTLHGGNNNNSNFLNKIRQSNKLDELIGRSPSTHSATSSSFSNEQGGGNLMASDNNFMPQLFGRGNCTRLEPFPIAQSQIEVYTLLDTEEIVHRVKEFLAKNAISQRQFGESILGLSQGSVSDLLARPKAWNLLTPKGREPFVRMQIFLEQYKKEIEDEEEEGNGALKIEEEEEEAPELQNNDDEREERSEIDDLAASNEDSEKLLQTILEQIKTEQTSAEPIQNVGKKTQIAGTKMGGNKGNNNRQIVENGQKQNEEPNNEEEEEEEVEINTVEVARRVKECLSKSGISQRAFGDHILKMTSGCVSDLLAKPKQWSLLSLKQRQSYQKMAEFLADSGAVDRLRSDEQSRCEMNKALNTLKATMAANATNSMAISPVDKSASGLAGLTALVEQHSSSYPAASLRSSSASTLQIVTTLASELGVNTNTPIGAILKKAANSPKPTATTNGQNNGFIGHTGGNKRKASMNGTAVPLSLVKIESNDAAMLGAPPAKKIPRFSRTLITEKQRQAMLFVFFHEQRPNSRCIEQLAAKIGLTPRTVTNWFHNYRTRQKGKKKPEEDGEELPTQTVITTPFSNGNSNSQTPTPAQVIAQALNSSDPKTTKWFREIAELLRRHSDANVDLDSIGTRGSLGTASAESSPDSPQQTNNNADCFFDEEPDREHSCEARSSASASSPPQLHHPNQAGGGSQLDKVIARMHSRLAATGKVQ